MASAGKTPAIPSATGVVTLQSVYSVLRVFDGLEKSDCSQSWKYREIFVVDHCSADKTAALARPCESDLLRVVAQQKQWVATGRNNRICLSAENRSQWLVGNSLLVPVKAVAPLRRTS